MKIYFELYVGLGCRSSVRQQLQNSKNKINHWYPEARVLFTENKDWFESKFYFEATNLPDTAEPQMRNWLNKLKTIENEKSS